MGRALLGASAVIAVLAAVAALVALPNTATETVLVDAWRAFGLVVFGGLFALLARDPRGYGGVLELAIVHKLAMVSMAWLWREAPDAILVMVADGALTAVLVVAYVLLRADRAWRPEAAGRPARTAATAVTATIESSPTTTGEDRVPAGTHTSSVLADERP